MAKFFKFNHSFLTLTLLLLLKQEFFQAVAVSELLYGCTSWTLMKTNGEKDRWEWHAMYCFDKNLQFLFSS